MQDKDRISGAASGAIFGGLVFGPLGAMIGAKLGSDIAVNSDGARKKRAAQDLGIDEATLDMIIILQNQIKSANDAYEYVKNTCDDRKRYVRTV